MKLSDLILRSPAERSEAGRLEGWPSRHPRPSFETHRKAMLLRMRLGEDADMIRTSETLY
jgi:hypothetical protein